MRVARTMALLRRWSSQRRQLSRREAARTTPRAWEAWARRPPGGRREAEDLFLFISELMVSRVIILELRALEGSGNQEA